MKDLIGSRAFIVSFLSSYGLFFLVTKVALDTKVDGVGVGSLDYGFPFVDYFSTCFGGDYVLPGVLGNIVFALMISVPVGVAVSYMHAKFSSAEFRRKWYI